jgi:tRNA pseudouridine38-40 synthase
MRYLLKVQYSGKNYPGFQRQKHSEGIQNILETALSDILHSQIQITAAGRTDAGVHADEQYIIFDADTLIVPINKITRVLNTKLPDDIRIINSKNVDQNFHPRYDCKVRHYRYTLINGNNFYPALNIALTEYSYCPGYLLEPDDIYAYLAPLIGAHDFSTFCALSDPSKSKIREIFDISVHEISPVIYIDIYGNAFLRNMVRSIIGNLLYALKNKLHKNYLLQLLKKKDPLSAGHRAPPQGLNLKKVYYQPLFGARKFYKKKEKIV